MNATRRAKARAILADVDGHLLADIRTMRYWATAGDNPPDGAGRLNFALMTIALIGCERLGFLASKEHRRRRQARPRRLHRRVHQSVLSHQAPFRRAPRDVPSEEFQQVVEAEYANYVQLLEHIMRSMKSLQPEKDIPFDAGGFLRGSQPWNTEPGVGPPRLLGVDAPIRSADTSSTPIAGESAR